MVDVHGDHVVIVLGDTVASAAADEDDRWAVGVGGVAGWDGNGSGKVGIVRCS